MIRRTRPAMHTVFTVSLPDSAARRDLLAADEALLEAERLDRLLSRFLPHSDISRINAAAGRHLVPISPETLALLTEIVRLAALTDGAFEPTVGPLMDLWRAGTGLPEPEALAEARSRVGLAGLQLEASPPQAGLLCEGMGLDLGGVGKGYGVDAVVATLAQLGVQQAVVDGGGSSARSLGRHGVLIGESVAQADQPLGELVLVDQAAAVSSVRGQGFEHEGRFLGHILDPRTGWPTQGPRLAAVTADSAVGAEVVSTALLVAGESLLDGLAERFPRTQALLFRDGLAESRSTPGWQAATSLS